MRNMTIGRKITLGFGIVLVLLAAATVLSYTGVGNIVGNAGEVIEGNKLDGELAQKEVDHLNWANQVNALLTDENVTELNVQTDPHKCGFGKWLYGEGRRQAEALVPSLAPLLKEIEKPHRHLHESAIAIGKNFKPADTHLPGFMCRKEVDHLNWADKINQLFLQNKQKLAIQTDPKMCAFGKWLYGPEAKRLAESDPQMANLLEAIKEPHAKLHASAVDIAKSYRQIHPGLVDILKDRLDDHRVWIQKVAVGILEGKTNLGVAVDPAQCGLGKFLASPEAEKYMAQFPLFQEEVAKLAEPHKALHESATRIEQALKQGDRAKAESIFKNVSLPAVEKVAGHLQNIITAESQLVSGQKQARNIYENSTVPALTKTRSFLLQIQNQASDLLKGQAQANRIFTTETLPSLHETQELLAKLRQEARKNIMTDQTMLSSAQSTRWQVIVVGIVAVVVGVLLSFFIVGGITTVLKNISNGLGTGADQVASASTQVSSSSQQLAEGASEQAASLEETSSSMEEMASMTKSNADNASQADSLMKEAGGIIEEAARSMEEMANSMEKIAQSGGEIGKIVKSIDEIAFQTNLLALNAAVEAARAGEAGAGFAVVADEVRALAMRAAEAAQTTQQLVEETVTSIEQGSTLVAQTQEGFKRVTASTQQVGSLVSEIASASGEQSEGITQVNQAITQMDQVIQQTAASAEEGASASEELSAQAISMQEIVGQLLAMVGGAGNDDPGIKNRKQIGTSRRRTAPVQITHHKSKPTREVRPSEVISFEDDEIGDF